MTHPHIILVSLFCKYASGGDAWVLEDIVCGDIWQ